MEQRTPEAEKTALQDLLQSDGWQIVRELITQRFSADACLREIDAAMAELRPGDDERAVVTQIRAGYKAARLVLELPKDRLRQLDQATKGADLADAFAVFRRGPKRA